MSLWSLSRVFLCCHQTQPHENGVRKKILNEWHPLFSTNQQFDPISHWQGLDGGFAYSWKPCVWPLSSVALKTARFKFKSQGISTRQSKWCLFISSRNPPTLGGHFYCCNITVLLQMTVTQRAPKAMFCLHLDLERAGGAQYPAW